MVRRTKEESLETRRAIIDAARAVFFRHGVTRTSLEQIAAAAGVTRGAIYWHFADKAELFYAMRDQVKIPLIDRSDVALADDARFDPLERIEAFLQVVIERISNDDATRETFQIMTFKCEYVGEFARDLDAMSPIHLELRDKLAKLYRQAKRRGLLRAGIAPLCAASDTLIFLSGLIKIWIVDVTGALVRRHAERLVHDHVDAKRATPKPVAIVDRATPKPKRTAVDGAPRALSRAAAK